VGAAAALRRFAASAASPAAATVRPLAARRRASALVRAAGRGSAEGDLAPKPERRPSSGQLGGRGGVSGGRSGGGRAPSPGRGVSAGRRDPRQLTAAIKVCSSVAELEAALRGADPAAVNFIHLSAALGLLPKLLGVREEKRRLWSSLALRFSALDMLATAGPRELSNALWAAAKLADGGVLEASSAEVAAFVDAVVSELQRENKLSDANAHDSANTLWALATLGRTGDGAFVAALLAAAHPQLGSFTLQGLINMVWALATLAHYDEPFLDAAADCVLSQADRLNPQDYSNTAHAFAALRHPRAAALVAALVERSAARLGVFNEQNLSNLLWAAAAADVRSLSAAALGALAAECARQERAPLWIPANLSQLHLAHAHVQGAYGDRALLPPPLLARCAEAQRLQHEHNAAQPPSDSQRQLAAALRRLGLSPQEEAPALDGAYSIDALLVTPGGARVAVEFDGPRHFAANAPGHALGDTALRDRLLSGAGFVVVRVSYREWDGKSEAQQEALLRGRLRSAGVL